MSTELAPIQTMSMGDMTQLASAVAASKLFGMQSPEQALVLMAICQSEGKSPIQATKIYHIINGRPSMRADAMQAEFQARGGEIVFHSRDEAACEATFTWGKTSVTVKWTMAMANAAGLTSKGGPWKTAPRSMLHARCVSEGVRAVMPGVVAGIYTPEEIEDISTEPLPLPSTIRQQPQPRAIAPANAPQSAPAPPPDWNPKDEFYALAKQRGFVIHNDQGQVSKSKLEALLCQIYHSTTVEVPTRRSMWESALKALEVYQGESEGVTLPAGADPDLSDLDDPFQE